MVSVLDNKIKRLLNYIYILFSDRYIRISSLGKIYHLKTYTKRADNWGSIIFNLN